MNGKVLKVKQYNLEFGGHDRFINVLGCFKYKPAGNIYIVYSDVDVKYSVIYYGSGHVKGNTALCMQCREKAEEEIIKEYIFKLIQKEDMSNFEMISVEEAEGIEIIGSSKFEVKPEILTSLIDIVIPKPEIKEEAKKESTTKKKNNPLKTILLLLVLVCLLGGGYLFIFGINNKDTTEKNIICTKSYQHDTLIASVEETNKYNFNVNDTLESVDTTMVYQFNKESYQDFILKGTYYKYMPSSDTEGGWDKDDDNYIFKVMTKERIDTSYSDPTDYEEVLSYYKIKGYTCTERLENE